MNPAKLVGSKPASKKPPRLSQQQQQQLPQPPPPHQSSAAIPTLASAPNSGNISLPPPPPPPPSSSSARTGNSSTLQLPPPPSVGRSTGNVNTHTSSTSSSSSAADGASRFRPSSSSSRPSSSQNKVLSPLPPPPVLKKPPSSNSNNSAHAPRPPSLGVTSPRSTNRSPPPPSISTPDMVPPPDDGFDLSTTLESSPVTQTLPISIFKKKDPLLALRQSHIPVAIVSTEAAQTMAHKNGLQLPDIFNGLAQQLSATGGGNSNNSNNSSSDVPFRSITKSLYLTHQDLQVRFRDISVWNNNNDNTKVDLPAACRLQPADGNLEQDLCLLEDQVDHILQQEEEDRKRDDRATMQTSSSSTTASATSTASGSSSSKQLADVTASAFRLTSPLGIPWMVRYRQALDESTNDLEHDLISCPPLILYVCTTAEAVHNPIETLQSLQSIHSLPPPYHDGQWDPYCSSSGNSAGSGSSNTNSGPRQEVLVLHDNVDGPPNNSLDEVSLRQALQRNFGAGAAVLRINSISRTTAAQLALEENTDAWQGCGKLGNCLSVADRVILRNYIVTLITSSLLPALERRIADLNAIVSDRKKGVKNVLKSFWRTGKDDGGEGLLSPSLSAAEKNKQVHDSTSGHVEYRHDTIESQTRLLADTLFLIRDYEAALSTYRLVKDDFKQDKAHVHYASVQEMMALCLYKLDPYVRAREVFSHVENALLGYTRASALETNNDKGGRPTIAPTATRLATRLCLVLVAAKHVCGDNSGRHLEVADLLASGSSHETALGAAVLLEQASAQYYHAALYRKYAFHMLMAGHMFRTAQQEHHAFRCFVSALYVYQEWRELHHHLRSALAAQLYGMGRMALSLQLYAKLLGSGGRVSTKSQQKFIQHLQEICRDHGKKALVGADRMAAASGQYNGQNIGRNSFCQARLDRIVQVIRYTKSAARILEIPNMDLPCIDDESVHVVVGSTTKDHEIDPSSVFGNPRRGSDEMWDQLTLATSAELKVASPEYKESDVTTKALAKIDDPKIRLVLSEIDRERKNHAMLERSKRSASYKEKPPVRALREPITISFSVKNPLGIPVQVNEIQLVARMTENQTGYLCTNEDAIKITPLVSYDQAKSWTFSETDKEEYTAASFCRISTTREAGDISIQPWKSAEEAEPFFVVTKGDLLLDPEAEKLVSASLCPLVQGELEIVGVRFKLLDEIWVFHPFVVKGQLLQNSRENRASRKRAESVLLKASIQRGMPSLSAEFLPSSSAAGNGPALDGQISTWTLRLSNTGTASATNVALKTNKPWINIPPHGSDTRSSNPTEQERKAHSYCVGPSGTLMQVPIQGPSLQNDNHILPGESIEVPVEVRTTGVGKQDLYFLFRYDLSDDGEQADESDNTQHRWLRKMFEIQVYPSVTMSSRIIPSSTDQGESLLSLELTNCRSDQPDKLEVAFRQLSLASPLYRIEPLPGQLPSTGASAGWQERVTIHFRVIPNESPSPTCLLSKVSLEDSEQRMTSAQASMSSLLDFMCLERASQFFECVWSSHRRDLARAALEGEDEQPQSISSIRRANTSTQVDTASTDRPVDDNAIAEPTSIAKLSSSESGAELVHLVCTWQTPDDAICGQHHISGLNVRHSNLLSNCPIVVTADYEETMAHDFDKGPALVPLKISISNRLVKGLVQFEFSMEYDSFDMIGPGCFQRALNGSEGVTVNLTALLPSAGMYDLQRVHLKVQVLDGEEQDSKTYTFDSQWMVTLLSTT